MADREVLVALAGACQRFSPTVGIEEGDKLAFCSLYSGVPRG
jgi:hypothetical protein